MSSLARLLLLCSLASAGLLSSCAGSDSGAGDVDETDGPSTADDGDTTDDSADDDSAGDVDARVVAKDASVPKKDGSAASGNDAGVKGDGGGGGGGGAGDSGTTKSDGGPVVAGKVGRCVKKPSQVMIIGDSYINWPTHTLPAALATASGQNGWRLNAIGGASMATGGIATIVPQQFEGSYNGDKDVHTVVMDGGGNDILIPDATLDGTSQCKNSEMSATMPNCKKIVQTANDAFTKLITRMAGVGVQDVVYFFYPHIPDGTLLGGAHPNVINDYARPTFKSVCDGASAQTSGKLRCHFVDMVPVFKGHDDWFFPGDLHPTSVASPAMAGAIWKVMQDACVGQTSGCCTP